MIGAKEKIEDLGKQYKGQSEAKGNRDITQEFVLRSKLRDLNNECRVCVLIAYKKKTILCCFSLCILGVGSAL